MNVCWGCLDVNKPALTSLEPLNVAVTTVMLWTVMEKAVLKVSFYFVLIFIFETKEFLVQNWAFQIWKKEKKMIAWNYQYAIFCLLGNVETVLYVELIFCSHMTS